MSMVLGAADIGMVREEAFVTTDGGYVPYFTEEEYRDITKDTSAPAKAQQPDISLVQMEVVGRLERWARSAWSPKVGYHSQLWHAPVMVLPYTPIRRVMSMTWGETDLMAGMGADWVMDAGVIRWLPGRWTLLDPAPWVQVTFEYGFEDVPWEVKIPCIRATEARIQERRSKIPRNTTSYRSEGTTLQLRPSAPAAPWPWDREASDDIRAYWKSFRPHRYVG